MERAYGWVHAAARVLNNHQDESAAVVRRRFDGLVGAMVRHRGKAGALDDAILHFRKVARSYRPGLFHCHAVPGLPRTNNVIDAAVNGLADAIATFNLRDLRAPAARFGIMAEPPADTLRRTR